MKKIVYSLISISLALVFNAKIYAAPFDISGFIETDYGVKVSDDKTKNDSFNMLEQRLQLKGVHYFQGNNYLSDTQASINAKVDFTVDEYFSGKTSADLRELNFAFTPLDILDVKAGRQVLTWGTGDYLFINDMFPKDYISFYMGRDDEYLKKPSDAIKFSAYPSPVNIDFIVMLFEPNTIPKGDRLSFFDSFQKGIAGRSSDRDLLEPPLQMSNNEYALRLYRSLGSNELAFYYFRGFDKNPSSYKNEANRQLFYRRLDVYGWSLRGPFAKGIGNMEFGYYNSREDPNGDNRLIENSFIKFLSGYTKDLGSDLKIGLQYMYEQRLDYDNYRDNLLAQDYFWDESRHVVTNRITKLYKNQTVMVSLFTFYSPSDRDGYVRPSLSYDLSDQWKVVFGANMPWGEDNITAFGQMKKNKNVFARARYSF